MVLALWSAESTAIACEFRGETATRSTTSTDVEFDAPAAPLRERAPILITASVDRPASAGEPHRLLIEYDTPRGQRAEPEPLYVWVHSQAPACIRSSVPASAVEPIRFMHGRGIVEVPLDCPAHLFDRSLGFAVAVFRVMPGGDLVASSPTRVVHHPSRTPRTSASIPILCMILGLGFIGLWNWYRRETEPEYKIRLAGTVGLASLLFLAVTPAMPWVTADRSAETEAGITGSATEVPCMLGREVECAARFGNIAPLAEAATDPTLRHARLFELQRWEGASVAVRVGQVLALLMLLPLFIWVIVVPRNSFAQASVAIGATGAMFTGLAIILYRVAIPSWVGAEIYWTADAALLAAANIVVAAFLIIKHGVSLLDRNNLPGARVVR